MCTACSDDPFGLEFSRKYRDFWCIKHRERYRIRMFGSGISAGCESCGREFEARQEAWIAAGSPLPIPPQFLS